jgi:hypothetical protein
VKAARAELNRSTELQNAIWMQAVAACRSPEGQGSSVVVLPALNEMFDIVTNRSMALLTHPPLIIYLLLMGLALISALLAGFGMAGAQRRSWPHFLCFPTMVAICLLVILDLEFPRTGFIRIDPVDQLLTNQRESMR